MEAEAKTSASLSCWVWISPRLVGWLACECREMKLQRVAAATVSPAPATGMMYWQDETR